MAPRYLSTIAGGLGAAIEAVLKAYQARGQLEASLDAHELAFLLTRMERIHFLNYVYLKAMTVDELHAAIARDVAIIVGPYVREG